MINLLPEREKKELAKEENYRKVSLILLFVLLAVLFLAVLSYSLKFYFISKIRENSDLLSKKQEALAHSGFQGFQKKINGLNQDLTEINQSFRSQIFLSSVFEDVSSIMPDSIYLTNFSFQKKYQQTEKEVKVVNNIYISGWARDRADLSLFKDRLEGSGKFKKVYFLPVSWVKAKDVDFSLALEYEP